MGGLNSLIIFICFFACLSLAVLFFLIFFLSKKFKTKRDETLNEDSSNAELPYDTYNEEQQKQSTDSQGASPIPTPVSTDLPVDENGKDSVQQVEDNGNESADEELSIPNDLVFALRDYGYSQEQVLALANMQRHDPDLTADKLKMVFKPSMAAEDIKEKIKLFYGE